MRLRDGKSLHLAFWRPRLAVGHRSVMSRAGGEFSQHEGHIPTTGDTGRRQGGGHGAVGRAGDTGPSAPAFCGAQPWGGTQLPLVQAKQCVVCRELKT